MGRWSRRFTVRLCVAGAALAGGWVSYHCWQLRRGAVLSINTSALPSQSRAARLQRLESSNQENPLDVLIVGGGATGLYAAVDAAQRGLRVAVVDADDFGAASTTTSPPLLPGAFPFVQRALRQRDALWLRRAAETSRALIVWSNVAPGIVDNRVSSIISSAHVLELMELVTAGVISVFLSLLCGAFKPIRFVRGKTLTDELLGAEDSLRGGLVVQDATLDAAAASIALARTAEALDAVVLNYASVTSITNVSSMHEPMKKTNAKFAVVVNDVSAPKDTDKSASQPITVYTRSIINCAGSWVDEVKQLLPGNSADTVPSAFGGYQIMSYLVVPRTAVLSGTRKKEFNSVFGVEAMFASPTSYSFSSVMLLPWFDQCMLIGPSISPLRQPPSRVFSSKLSTFPSTLIDTSASGSEISEVGVLESTHKACRKHICRGLNASGIIVDEKRILSSLSCIVPVITEPQTVSWAEDILLEGYHISVGEEQPYVVHVYGGSLCLARDIAEKALDRLLRDSRAFTESETKLLRSCQTRQLALVGAQLKDTNAKSTSPTLRLLEFLREEYAVRLLDVVARRTRVAYSSPAEALAALPAIADVMSKELNWSAERKQAELDLVEAFIRSISVA